MRMTNINLFCPKCNAYLGHARRGLVLKTCLACGWKRPSHERLYHPGETLWETDLGLNSRGPLIVHENLILCPLGERGGSNGGVVALDRGSGDLKWKVNTSAPVEHGLCAVGEHLLIASLGGLLGIGADIQCCLLPDGELLWKKELSAGVWSPPHVREARIYIACSDGLVHCLDRYTGNEVIGWPRTFRRGRMYSLLTPTSLIVCEWNGQINILDPIHGYLRWSLTIDGDLRNLPYLADNHLYLGTQEGKLYAIDLVHRHVRLLADDLLLVSTTPLVEYDVVYVNGRDRTLRAVTIQDGMEKWRQVLPRSASTMPVLGEGLVVVGTNDGFLRAFDAESGFPVWDYSDLPGGPILGNPAFSRGVFYFVSYTGKAYALPWHLGQYAWAAETMEHRGQPTIAADNYILASYFSHNSSERNSFYQKAEECWEQACTTEWAARFREGLAQYRRAGEFYCQAAEHQRGWDNRMAAEYYNRAAQLFWQQGLFQRAGECDHLAAELARWPNLRLQAFNVPAMVQRESGWLTVRVENIGFSAAYNLKFNLGGSLLNAVSLQVVDPLDAGSHFDINMEVFPTHTSSSLSVEVRYQTTEEHKQLFTRIVNLEIVAAPQPTKIKTGDMIRGKLKVVNPNNQPVEIEVGDQALSEIEIRMGD